MKPLLMPITVEANEVNRCVSGLSDLELVFLANFIRKTTVVDAGDAGPPLKKLLDAIDEDMKPKELLDEK